MHVKACIIAFGNSGPCSAWNYARLHDSVRWFSKDQLSLNLLSLLLVNMPGFGDQVEKDVAELRLYSCTSALNTMMEHDAMHRDSGFNIDSG